MSKTEARNLIERINFRNDFERITILKTILSSVPGAGIKELNLFYYLSKNGNK